MLDDPLFYAVAVPAVVLIGLAKGGLGGAMALLGVPLMALAMPPVQAAAILLPILIVMDMVSLSAWRRHNDSATLRIMMPGAVLGVAIGWAAAAIVTDAAVRLLVGVMALFFFLDYLRKTLGAGNRRDGPGRPHDVPKGLFWGTLSGFTSFVSHAGGPPYQFYTLPLRQDPKIYTGTSVRFFAAVNALKLVPYFMLGQFDADNLQASAVLLPLAAVATLAGAWVVRRLKPQIFYPIMYAMVLLAGLKLIYDGAGGLVG